MQKRIAVEHEKHEDGLRNKKGEAHDSLDNISCSEIQYLSLTQTILVKMTLFNPFAPEPPVTARTDPGPFYPL